MFLLTCCIGKASVFYTFFNVFNIDLSRAVPIKFYLCVALMRFGALMCLGFMLMKIP